MRTDLSLTRREGLKLSAPILASLAVGDWGVRDLVAAETEGLQPLNRFPRMVHNHYVDLIRGFERRTLEMKGALETEEDARMYVAAVQERIRRVMAPMPMIKSLLKPQVTGIVERDTYTVEKIIFESRPKFYVTANLYLPKGISEPVPGVVGTCGHSRNGKLAEAYQSFAQGLARLGYACLIYDPIGQGERSQYLEEDLKLIYPGTTHEHNMAGNQQCLVGEFLGAWRTWDGIRALDYLLTRKEVDPNHIGVTGNSGGGTLTTWLCGVEPRWTMAAPACFVTTWRRNLENELPQDNEQCPPRSIGNGLDHDDYLAAMAPKPVVILAKEQDFFDVRGAEEAYGRLKNLYRLLGAEENIQLHIGPTDHGYSQENREAMYRFFNDITEVSEAEEEPELVIEEDATLYCTPNGQVAELERARTVFSFTRDKAERLREVRKESTDTEMNLKLGVETALRLSQEDAEVVPDFRVLRAGSGDRKYPTKFYINYAVETDPGIQAIVTYLSEVRRHSRPSQAEEVSRAVLYVSDRSADAELREEGWLRDLIAEEKGAAIFACDVRGVGDSQPATTTQKDPHAYYGADYFYAAYALMFNRPMVGRRTVDVLRVLSFLRAHGYDEIHLVAKRMGALPGAFAALFSDVVKAVTLKEPLESYDAIATSEHYAWPLSALAPNALRYFDLPDVYEALEDKGLRLIDPLDASGQLA